MAGPLAGVRVLDLGGVGPGPHGAMMLGDLGADVVRVDRAGSGQTSDLLRRSRRSIVADLKQPADKELIGRLARCADVLIEGFRPGVAERLGLGPDECCAENPRLVYARMTGWGQTGPLAHDVGHDIDYLALTGALHAIGHANDRPAVPLNLIGDFGGGSMLLVAGVLAALLEREKSGLGQVVDVAIVDGASLLMQMQWSLLAEGRWVDQRESNVLDSGAPYYDTYLCADGRYVAVGAIEPQFYDSFVAGLGLDSAELPDRGDATNWRALRSRFAEALLSAPRQEWLRRFEGTDACVAPVLSMEEVATHRHIAERRTVRQINGVLQAAPAPRFSRTPPAEPAPPPVPDADRSAIIADWLGEPASSSDMQ